MTGAVTWLIKWEDSTSARMNFYGKESEKRARSSNKRHDVDYDTFYPASY